MITAMAASSRDPNLAASHLQNALNRFQRWCIKWKIALNPENTQAVMYRHRRSRSDREMIIANTLEEWTNKAKYLRVILDRKLTLTEHVKQAVYKPKALRSQLSSVIGKKSKLCFKTKMRGANSIILPSLTDTKLSAFPFNQKPLSNFPQLFRHI
ncbi:unnamed protein product [Diabrotica balteata]|uniref:Uncharacterized protein n=1 Tax=Diabrotica balteata TaxID=107213 RepID=A0A9P0GZT9_DIABA|nr:unnamed protein product [Diabrotica balteata]